MAKKDNFFKTKFIAHKKLAQERTTLANERTMLAYIRTGLAFFILGIALVKLLEESIEFVYVGYLVLGVGMFFILVGILSYYIKKKRIISY